MSGEMIERFFDWYDSAEYVAVYNTRREALRGLFSGYQSATGKDRELMNWLLTANASHCKQDGRPEVQRKHNAFVLRYVAGCSIKEIARHQSISIGTVYRDISAVLDCMMVLSFGIEGMIPYEWVNVCDMP